MNLLGRESGVQGPSQSEWAAPWVRKVAPHGGCFLANISTLPTETSRRILPQPPPSRAMLRLLAALLPALSSASRSRREFLAVRLPSRITLRPRSSPSADRRLIRKSPATPTVTPAPRTRDSALPGTFKDGSTRRNRSANRPNRMVEAPKAKVPAGASAAPRRAARRAIGTPPPTRPR